MEEILEIKSRVMVTKMLDFALKAFTLDEKKLYDNFEYIFKKACAFDIFNEELVYKYITSGQISAYVVKDGEEVLSACALEERSGRMLFFLESSLGKTKRSAKQLLKMLETKMKTPLTLGEYRFTLLAFYNGAKKLQEIGFKKIKSEIIIDGVRFTAIEYRQEQPDFEIY